MILYFSGVALSFEAELLLAAGVDNWLADPVDFDNLPAGTGHERVLDSGAYRAFKAGKTVDVQEYVSQAIALEVSGQCAWAVAPDVIGDPVATRRNWELVEQIAWYDDECGHNQASIFPVFQWGAPYADLEYYAGTSPVVCIGGLVPLMRAKDKATLEELKRICRDYQGLHLLGLNWLKAIEDLADYEGTYDTSKWLDAARYGHLIFQNTRTGHLSQAPARALKLDLDRKERCVQSAINMREYLEKKAA